jgi:BolA family transcriptional regulator, general stress-responsive regulator
MTDFSIAPGVTSVEIGRRLVQAFGPVALTVADESEGHRGHGGHREGVQTHLLVTIVAPAFAGLSRVAAQRLVHQQLIDLMDNPIHALTVKASAV